MIAYTGAWDYECITDMGGVSPGQLKSGTVINSYEKLKNVRGPRYKPALSVLSIICTVFLLSFISFHDLHREVITTAKNEFLQKLEESISICPASRDRLERGRFVRKLPTDMLSNYTF